jgi:hypothetical protein
MPILYGFLLMCDLRERLTSDVPACHLSKQMASKNSISDTREARVVAVGMLQAGIATPSEVARCAGVSRQLVQYWARVAKLKPGKARDGWLAKEWRKRIG